MDAKAYTAARLAEARENLSIARAEAERTAGLEGAEGRSKHAGAKAVAKSHEKQVTYWEAEVAKANGPVG